MSEDESSIGRYCGELHLPKSRYKPLPSEEKTDNQDNNNNQDNNKENNNNNNPSSSSSSSSLSSSSSSSSDSSIKRIRIVHISDTHLKHRQFEKAIPNGDILIHSGDFSDKKENSRFQKSPNLTLINDFNKWLGSQPHKYKIFVAGNHETNLMQYTAQQVQELLTNCIYLQDSGTELFGIQFYGSPYMTRMPIKNAYATTEAILKTKWDAIPDSTDILITHIPPFNILDLAWGKNYNNVNTCDHCGETHVKYDHWGDDYLKNQIFQRIRPLAHLFGHVHDDFDQKKEDDILFVNSSMDLSAKCHYMDIVFDLTDEEWDQKKNSSSQLQQQQQTTPSNRRRCVIL